MKDIRNLPYRTYNALIPNYLFEIKPNCPKCQKPNEVPWTEKLDVPKHPIQSADGKWWVHGGIPLTCQHCANEFHVTVPPKETESTWNFYGDEAERFININRPGRSDEELHVFCVTLAGIHKKRRKKLERKINDLKKSIAPNSNPDDWSHHFKDIWSSKAAENFSNLGSLNDRINYGLQFSDHLRSLRPHLVTMTCIMAKPLPVEKAERAKSIKMNKEEVFSHSLVSSLEYVRKNKKKIRWIFDKLKDGQNPEGWAKETFLGLQYTRLFTWLSHRAYVPEPEFREPGSDVLSEVADYISFCAAREVFKRAKGDEPELPTARFGKSFYFTIDNNGNAYSKSSVGMPMERLINYT